jgi:hypothetical protein
MRNYKGLKDYFNLIESEELKRLLIDSLENLRLNIDEEDRNNMSREFAGGNDEYSLLNSIRVSDDEKCKFLTRQFLNGFDLNYLPVFYAEVFKKMMDLKLSPVNDFKRLKNAAIRKAAEYLSCAGMEYRDQLVEYLKGTPIRSSDFHGCRVYSIVGWVILEERAESVRKGKTSLTQEYHDIFNQFIKTGINYVCSLYSIEKFRIACRTMDSSMDKLFIFMYLSREAALRGDLLNGIRYYKEAVLEFPSISLYLDYYTREFLQSHENLTIKDNEKNPINNI